MGTADYDILLFNPSSYRAESLDEVREVVGGFFRHLHRRLDKRDARAGARDGLTGYFPAWSAGSTAMS